MTNLETNSSENTNQQASSGLGQRLRMAREAKSLTQEQVAEELRLSLTLIKNIDNDNFAEGDQPQHTFLKGYLRNYAKLVGIPEQEIMQQFDQLNLTDKPSNIRIEMRPTRRQLSIMNEKTMRWVTYFIVAVLVILVMIWWHSRSTPNDKTTLPSDQTTTSMQTPTESTQSTTTDGQQKAAKTAKSADNNNKSSTIKNVAVKIPLKESTAKKQDNKTKDKITAATQKSTTPELQASKKTPATITNQQTSIKKDNNSASNKSQTMVSLPSPSDLTG